MDAVERRLLWEVLCSFDGHPTHPCAKTKIGLDVLDLPRFCPEFAPLVQLPVAALARQAAREGLAASAGVSSASLYFARHFGAEYALWQSWLASCDKQCNDFVPIPIHPVNLEHVRGTFAALEPTFRLLVFRRRVDALQGPAVE